MATKMSEEDKKYWQKILDIVEKEFLNYDSNQHIQKMAVLKLKGLQTGKVVANKNIKDNGNYSYKVIYATCLMCRKKIIEAVSNKDFDSEAGEVGYICAILRNNLNKAYKILKEKEELDKKTETMNTEEIGHVGVEYTGIEYKQIKTETKNTRENKYEGLW